MSNKAVRSKGNSSYQTPSNSPKPQKWAQPEWTTGGLLSLTSDRGHRLPVVPISISKLMLPSAASGLSSPLHHIYNKELPLIHTMERSCSYRSSEFNLHHCKIKESQPPGFKVVNITLKRWMRRELFKVPVEWVLPIRCRQKVKRVMEPQLVLQFIPSWPVRACAPARSPSAPP